MREVYPRERPGLRHRRRLHGGHCGRHNQSGLPAGLRVLDVPAAGLRPHFPGSGLAGFAGRLLPGRAGLVGGDGAVHHGYLDIAYLRAFQNMVLMRRPTSRNCWRPYGSDSSSSSPTHRYPRDSVPRSVRRSAAVPCGQEPDDARAWMRRYSPMVQQCSPRQEAAQTLEAEGIDACVVNARSPNRLMRTCSRPRSRRHAGADDRRSFGRGRLRQRCAGNC